MKKKMLILGLEPTWSVFEAYWYGVTMGSATTKYSKDLHCSQYPSFAAEILQMPQKINEC
jgi:hypothetical protein